MYAEHFGFQEIPFSIAPDPRYLYLSGRHKNALAHLRYGIQSDGGFILLTGEVGTGKTTLCRSLLEEIPEGVETAFVLNPLLTVAELLATICDEFGIKYPRKAGMKQLVDLLNEHLLNCHAAGKKCVLIIDEAQNLVSDVLEQLRLLTNLETNQRKLLQIILLGQPELLELLKRNELRQFNQRITARYHLEALNFEETCEYILHRLSVAGGNASVFPRAALRRAYRISRGIPRVINLVCDRALLGTYAKGQYTVSPDTLSRAASEVLGIPARRTGIWLAAACLALFSLAAAWFLAERMTAGKGEVDKPAVAESFAQPEGADAGARRQDDIKDIVGHGNLNAAYHDLFALWGTAFEDKQAPPCDLAANIGLGCFSTATSLEGVQSLNRPVIVQLNGSWLTVSAMTGDAVTLIAGARQFEISTATFRDNWAGNARLLWNMPPGWSAPLQLQDTGVTVDWLVSQLEIATGYVPEQSNGNAYDEKLVGQVSSFQTSVGLLPTGIVDVPTLIHLNSANSTPAVTTPVLARKAGRS